MNLSKSSTTSLRWQTVAAFLSALILAPASQAVVFQSGDIKGSFDTTISIGALGRIGQPDKAYIATSAGGQQQSVNNDDGAQNYNRGLASLLLKASHELSVNYNSAGVFVRGFYFNDFTNSNGRRDRTELSAEAQKIVGQNGELLDAYVYFKPKLGDMPASLRIGRQVLSWGESTFIPNGINSINPIDVGKLRTPGSELKEALRPLNMVSASLNVTENLTFEAFYLLDWERTRVDPPGTYFSTNDFVAKGGTRVYLGFGAVPDTANFNFVLRGADREAKKSGQWGVAARYLAEGLNNTEFGFYHLRYHSRLPVISARSPTVPINGAAAGAAAGAILGANGAFLGQVGAAIGSGDPAAIGATLSTLIGAALTRVPVGNLPAALQPLYPTVQAVAGPALNQQVAISIATSRYLIEFPEDIKVTGVSFNTSLNGIALQGELSYRQGQPLQVDDVELLFATFGSINPAFANNNQIGSFVGQLNTYIPGFRRFSTWQGQMTATKVSGGIFGADQSTFLGEIGFVNVSDLPSKDTLRFDGPGTVVGGNLAAMTATGNGAFGSEPASAFADKFSWGYQLVGRLDYNNFYAGVNVSPLIVFAHDVKGNTPLPIGNFLKGRKSLTVGAEFTFQNAWALDIRYVNFFGAGRFNLLGDRDYVSANLKYSF